MSCLVDPMPAGPLLVSNGQTVEIRPFTIEDVDWLIGLPRARMIAWNFGWPRPLTREFGELLATAWERGKGAYFRFQAPRSEGMVWAVLLPDSRVAVCGFDQSLPSRGSDPAWIEPEAMACLFGTLFAWVRRQEVGEPYCSIPCADFRYVKFANEHGLPWRSRSTGADHRDEIPW